jgi:protein required for attachment to host cells
MTTWILVANTSGAKLFSAELREDTWTLLKHFDHPQGRETSKEMSPSSPPGRMQQGQSAGGHHTAVEQRTTPKEAEVERFAQHLASHLEQSIAQRQYDQVVLVAPPHFLGALKGALGKQAGKHVRATLSKDVIMFEPAEIRERLLDEVFPLNSSPS